MAKIILERAKCIGCGSCEALCPQYWKLGGEGKAELLNSKKREGSEDWELELEDVGCNREAAETCPVQCIRIEK